MPPRWLGGIIVTIGALLWNTPAMWAQAPHLEFQHLAIEHGLSQSIVDRMLQDRQGFLWFVTEDGLNRFDGYTFKIFKHDARNAASLIHNEIKCVYEDRDGDLWIGTFHRGLVCFDPITQRFTHHQHDPADSTSLANDIVWDVCEDREGRLWVATGGGLDRLDRSTGSFRHSRHDPRDPTTLSHDDVRVLHLDRDGALWVGTAGGGLCRLDPRTQRFVRYRRDPADVHSLGGTDVRCLAEDRDGALWVGTGDGGLNRFDPRTGAFTRYRHDPRDPQSLGQDAVPALLIDSAGTIWAGTDGGGLCRFDRATGTFARYQHDPYIAGSLAGNRIRSLVEDRAGVLWVGTYGDGISRCSLRRKPFRHVRSRPDDPHSLGHDIVWSFLQDGDRVLWLGTHDGGLDRYDPATGRFTHFRHVPGDPNTPGHNSIRMVAQDHDGCLWLATNGGGLNRFDRATGTFTAIRRSDGLPDDAIYGILEDDRDCLWLSTNSGIARYDPDSGAVKTYTIADGLQSNEFNGGAYYRSPAGEMYFGGVNGFNVFFPDEIKDSEYQAPVVFTDFQLFNRTVPLGRMADGRTLLERSITHTERLALTHRDNVVSFEFAALDFTAAENNRYAYRLEGLSDDWINLGTHRFVMFTTLPAGNYALQVKGTNSDGVWNEIGTSLALIVRPPWWRTRWAEAGYTLLLMGVVLGLVWGARVRERARGRLVEAELRAQAAEMQSRVVAAESHVLRQENERKSQELEEARRLQLSMLPARLPRHAQYGITARMRPATEVGGDYYDYHVAADGTLTLAIGDATGHGTRAGIMVAIMKGMFARMCAEPDLSVFLQECNRTLCGIQLDQMYMALGLLRLKEYEARAVAAAMPPIFIHRRSTGRIEQITVRGMMLGAAFDLPYEEVRFTVDPGDTILLVSDGYLEQVSPSEEMLDEERCRNYFAAAIGLRPSAMIDQLLAQLDAWRGPVNQLDDVTIVILEVKG